MIRQDHFSAKFDVSLEELELYASEGLIFPIKSDDHIAYDDRSILRMHVITKAKANGFSDLEIKRIVAAIANRE